MSNTLIAGSKYDITALECVGWTPAGADTTGYNVADYFRDGVYLGADEEGVAPLFEAAAAI